MMLLPMLALTLDAQAISEVKNADRFFAEVAISRTEQNLIEIRGRRISSVIPSVAGALSYHKDDEHGVLYFTLANDQQMGTISMFVNDDHGARYKLILVPSNSSAQEIVLFPPNLNTVAEEKEKSKPTNEAHIAMIKQLMVHMASSTNGESLPDDIAITKVNENVPLWHEADLVLLNRYETDDLVGEEYQITNKTKVVLQLREQEFYRNNVYAVSVSKLALQPNETAFVYIVRGK